MSARPVAIIAEVGSVHDGSFGNALHLVATAARCGATAVKFQLHLAEHETTRDAPSPPYFTGEPRYEYFERTGFSPEQWRAIAKACEEAGVEFICSPFSVEAVAILEDVGVSSYKVASGEVTNTPLLDAVVATGKPVILSSGMSNWAELDVAVEALAPGGPVTLLQCSSMYPCPDERVGLNVLGEMRSRYGLPVGLSDHTHGSAAAVAAVALGAVAVEKHLTFSRAMYGSDAANGTEPDELADYAAAIRAVERMLANPVDKDDLSPYRDMKSIFEKSIVAATDIPAGTQIEAAHLAVKKPGTGIPPSRFGEVVGRRASRSIRRDALVLEDDLV